MHGIVVLQIPFILLYSFRKLCVCVIVRVSCCCFMSETILLKLLLQIHESKLHQASDGKTFCIVSSSKLLNSHQRLTTRGMRSSKHVDDSARIGPLSDAAAVPVSCGRGTACGEEIFWLKNVVLSEKAALFDQGWYNAATQKEVRQTLATCAATLPQNPRAAALND